MNRTSRVLLLAVSGAVVLASVASTQAAPDNAKSMLEQAAKANKHLVVLAWSDDDDTTSKLKSMIERYRVSLAGKALFYVLKTDDTADKDFVAKYKLTKAPLPLTLVFAPNGVVVGVFVQKTPDEKTLVASFASQKLASVLKLMQDGRIVLLCMQSQSSKYNTESLKAAQAAAADERAKGQIETLKLDPTDASCADLVAQLNVPASLEEATIRIVVPPGKIAGDVRGATTQAAVWDAIIKAISSCSGGGCGAGGCG